MKKKIIFWSLIFFLQVSPAIAADQNFVTPVFPIRGREFWRQGGDIKHFNQLRSLIPSTLARTWLVHYDVLFDSEIISSLKNDSQAEIGLFLEVTRKLSESSFVKYDWEHGSWSQANKVFLSGYDTASRKRIIDQAFSKFKEVLGYYPKSYGAWYIDVWSMEYIRQNYKADITLGLADQYSTDGYQTWGQYLNLPYFVSKTSAIEPALSSFDSTGVLKIQWAPRHPLLFWGDSVEYSNFSAQVNDYHRDKRLGVNYFSSLIKDITLNVQSPISQAVIGIEVAELEPEYFPELKSQLNLVSDLAAGNQIRVSTMQQFNKLYRDQFDSVSPVATMSSQIGNRKITWTMTPKFRQAVLNENGQENLVDFRLYHISNYQDNDQIMADTRQNLVRLVPKSSGFPLPDPITIPLNDSPYGHYSGRFSKVKSFIVNAAKLLPDLVYSKLDGQFFFGIKSDFETLVGVRFPKLKLGKFSFEFPILENFVSLKSKLTPHFAWTGKQEIELKPYVGSGKIFEKGRKYGQDSLLDLPKNIIFENSYYAVYQNP